MLRIAVCDDMQSYATVLEKRLTVWAVRTGTNVTIHKFDNGVALLMSINSTGAYDLIFMDVEMDRMNGLEAAAKIRKTDYLTTIIFISQYDNYFKDAYEVHPFHFLSKPIKISKLKTVMNSYMELENKDNETIRFCMNKSLYRLPLVEVMYLCSIKREIHVVKENEDFYFYGRLDDVQVFIDTMNNRFLRIHQSFLVNMKFIKEYHYDRMVMKNNEILLISKENRKRIRDIHMLFLEE